jgi:DnaJ-class molecular chaperone
MKILKHISVAALFSFALLLSSFAAISTNKVGISKQEEAAKKIAVLKQKYGNVVGTLNLPKFLLFEKKEETKLQKTLKLGLATNSNFVQINILANSKSRDISGSTNSFSADELLSAAIENYNNRVAVSWLVPPSFVLASPDVRLAFINKVVSQNPARLSSYEGMRYSIHAFGIPTAFSGSEWNLLSTAQTWTNDLNNLDNIYSYLWNFEIQNHTEIYYYGGGGGWELLPMQILLTAILDGNPQKYMAEEFNPFEQMFSQHFPFGMGNMGNRRNNRQENEDIVEKIDVTLEQLYNEETIDLTYKYKSYCQACNGEGYKPNCNPKCKSCHGKGMTVQVVRLGGMIQQSVVQCNTCGGSGKIVNEDSKCNQCFGNCFLEKTRTLPIQLKSGLTTENKINFSNKGNIYKNNKTNLIILINELPHNIYKRHKDDLFITLELKLYQALFGFTKIIKHLDNRLLNLSFNSKTDFNNIKFIQEEGMKSLNNNSKGNLYIKFIVKLPEINNFSDEDKSKLKEILISCETEDKIDDNLNQIKTKLNPIKKEKMNHINTIFDKDNNETSQNAKQQHHHQQQQQHHQQQQQNVQCAQQ